MAKKFDRIRLKLRSMEEIKAAEDEKWAKANIDWRKKLNLKPGQSLKDVELPDEFYESQLIKLDYLSFRRSHFKTISDIIAMSIDYDAYSLEEDLAMKFMYGKFLLPDGKISPLLPAVALSMIDIATKDAREKRVKTMREWRETMESLFKKMLPDDEDRHIDSKADERKFTVRQTAIIAYALCRKGGFIPKNKKSISKVFQNMTGRSANTLGMYLCSNYTDDEIEEIAVAVEKDMPEFASYLREKNFFLPEMKR